MKRHFSTKRTKYSNFCKIKTTAAIPTNFCELIPSNTIRGWSKNVPHKSRMINCYISATVTTRNTTAILHGWPFESIRFLSAEHYMRGLREADRGGLYWKRLGGKYARAKQWSPASWRSSWSFLRSLRIWARLHRRLQVLQRWVSEDPRLSASVSLSKVARLSLDPQSRRLRLTSTSAKVIVGLKRRQQLSV